MRSDRAACDRVAVGLYFRYSTDDRCTRSTVNSALVVTSTRLLDITWN